MNEQEENESRKIWKEVTFGLRINDMDKATNAKYAIEQKQRDDVRFRKENNISWQTRVKFYDLYYSVKFNYIMLIELKWSFAVI